MNATATNAADSYCGSFEVGKFYRVPCVKTNRFYPYAGGELLPIIGPEHRDADIVGFKPSHWHIDWRFASKRTWKAARPNRAPDGGHVYSVVVQRMAYQDELGPSMVEGDVQMRWRKCMREFPPYPHDLARWLGALEYAYRDARLQGMVCPHRGLPLEGCPRDGDVVQCPGHGLRWNVKTGALVNWTKASTATGGES